MKILAVRGRNLASIPWFELDLENGALSGTRIFAITGPTGSGKSTLLDAIALALYDRAPRLVGARDSGGDAQEIHGADPRAVMRRHASEAAAAVDFVGQDGVRYRAEWEVWRAHRRASGRIQSQRMMLFELESNRDISGATKTETLDLIRARVGLSFDEFRRAVLLAQGDFAAFLEARPDERAALLERMTGTRLFADLSRAAHRRAREEAHALEALILKKEAVRVLSPEDRESIVDEVCRLKSERTAIEQALKDAESSVAWHERDQALSAELAAARTILAERETAWDACAEIRTRLASRAEAERLAPQYRSFEAASMRLDTSAKAHSAANEDHQLRSAAATTAASALAAATRALTAIADAIEATAASVDRARTLDAQIVDATQELETAKNAFDDKDRTWRATAEALDTAKDQTDAAEKHRAEIDAWLEAHAELVPIATAWPKWETVLTDAIGLDADLREAESAAKSAELDAAAATAFAKQERARYVSTASRHSAARAEVQAIDEALEAHRRTGGEREISDARAIVAARISDLTRIEAIPRETKRLERERVEAQETNTTETDLAKRRKSERRLARAAHKKLRAKLTEAEEKFEEAEAIRTVASRRTELLTEGDPCPLCGSKDHPYGADGPTPKKAVRLKRRIKKLRTEIAELHAVANSSKDEDLLHAERARKAQTRAEEAAKEIELRAEEWQEKREQLALVWTESAVLAARGVRRLALQIPETPDETKAAKAAKSVRVALQKELTELEALGRLGGELSLRRTEAAAAAERLTEAKAIAEREATTAEGKGTERTTEAKRLQQRRAEGLARRDHLAAQLDLADGTFRREQFVQDPGALLTSLASSVKALESKRDARREAAVALEKTVSARAVVQTQCDHALEVRRAAEQAFTERSSRIDELRSARAMLLDGQAVEAFVRSNEASKAAAAEALAKRQHEAAEASEQQTSAAAREQELARILDEASRERAIAKLELTAELDGSSLTSIESLAERLAIDGRAIAADRATVEAAASARAAADTTANDCRARLETHRTSIEPALDANEATAARDDRRKRRDELVERTARAEGRLASDAEARSELEALAPKIESQRSDVDLWAELDEVIGSADGKKLRTFAQGLTLEVLLEQANLHLSQLRPRYRLRRVPGTDMELEVVDGDMGDEVRATSTLSGGERFLVSLALALGLSSLSSRSVRIESLFIDEGFGSLDADALEVALATLDQLQSEGRTIGIISHMTQIAERIGFQVEVRPLGPGRSEVVVNAV